MLLLLLLEVPSAGSATADGWCRRIVRETVTTKVPKRRQAKVAALVPATLFDRRCFNITSVSVLMLHLVHTSGLAQC
jgi:hypothetical protein